MDIKMDINFRILKKCQKTFKSYAKNDILM